MKLTDIAFVSRLPYRDGDGYSYGGEIIVTIGDRSFLLCAQDSELAEELALRWNARRFIESQEPAEQEK